MTKAEFKSGFVAIVGRPNVGKSTLLNAMLKDKVSIVSRIPQTTRHQIRGVLNLKDAQIVFVDTPGIHSFKDSLVTHLNTVAEKSLDGCDLVLYVTDISRVVGREEERVMKFLAKQNLPVIMVLNKMDLGQGHVNEYIDFWKRTVGDNDPLKYYMPVSATDGKNVDDLKQILLDNIPQGPPFYEKDTVTDFPLKLRIADIVREKLYSRLTKELPHSLAVEVEEMEEKLGQKGNPTIYIKVNIYVNRVSQRKIVIGKKGEGLREVGQAARFDIMPLFEKKRIYLDIMVKVVEDWQDKPRVLKELGYWWM